MESDEEVGGRLAPAVLHPWPHQRFAVKLDECLVAPEPAGAASSKDDTGDDHGANSPGSRVIVSRRTGQSAGAAQSAKPVPVIRQVAEILDAYRSSMGDPQSGVMFHTGAGQHLDIDKLVLRDVRPVAKSLDIDWYGLHGFRRGIASNLYELGADEKIVQRVLRHAKSHVTKDRYIKTFDPALVVAMKKLEATVNLVSQNAPRVH